MSYNEYTGENCEFGHPTYYQVLEMPAWGRHEESKRGPTCWHADCEAHQRWAAKEQRC